MFLAEKKEEPRALKRSAGVRPSSRRYSAGHSWADDLLGVVMPNMETDRHTESVADKETVAARAFKGLLAGVPVMMIIHAYLADAYSWDIMLYGYAGICMVAPQLGLCVVAYGVLESVIRARASVTVWPVFALLSGLSLLAVPFVIALASMILSEIPKYNVTGQSIEWETSRRSSEYHFHSYVLVLRGQGNTSQYQFSRGYLNWTGNEPAGFSDIGLAPLRFQLEYYQEPITLDQDQFITRVAASGVSAAEVQAIGQDMWRTLNDVNDGKAFDSRLGKLDPIFSHVDDEMSTLWGGYVWLVVVMFLFAVAGVVSIIPKKKTEPKCNANVAG